MYTHWGSSCAAHQETCTRASAYTKTGKPPECLVRECLNSLWCICKQNTGFSNFWALTMVPSCPQFSWSSSPNDQPHHHSRSSDQNFLVTPASLDLPGKLLAQNLHLSGPSILKHLPVLSSMAPHLFIPALPAVCIFLPNTCHLTHHTPFYCMCPTVWKLQRFICLFLFPK